MSKEQDEILTVIETEPTQDIILTAVEPEPTQLITTNEGIVHLPDATRTRKGVVKVGSGLNIESGKISLDESYIKVNEIHLNGNKVEPDEQKRVFLEVDKTTVGLSNVDNTSDLNKPVSTATQTELNKKLDKQQSPALADKYLHVSADGTIDFVPGVGGLIDVVKRNGVELEIIDRAVDVEVPVKTSELVNDGSDGEHPFITTGDIINNVTSTATDKPLSANMGYELKQQIDNVATIGRYLSQWDCTTGLPATNPTTLPYEYHRGDYYRVGTVGDTGVTRYKPSGTQYTGVASTEVETETDIKPDDIYFYDGAVWILQKVIVRDVSFGGIIGDPYDNTVLSDALDAKQDSINDLSTIRDNASAGKTASDTIATYGDVVTHNANEFVDTTTDQSIGGTKTFTSRPNVNSTNVALVDEIPEKTSALVNDSGFITSADIPTIPSKTSDLQNDSGFITSGDIPSTLPNPNKITFTKNGLTVTTYDGSSAKTVDLTESISGVTDVKINNTSIVSGTTATFNTKTAYNASTNKILTETDISDLVDKTSTQNISGTKNFDNLKFDGYEIKKTATDGVAITGSGVNMLLVEPGLGKEELNGRQVLFEEKVGALAYKDKVDYSNDVFNKPTIPTKTSELTNDSGFATTSDIATAKAQWLLDMNPIGTIIENNTGTNPSTYIGGTWELYGKGRVTVCIDSNDLSFDTAGKTGGSKALQRHTHTATFTGTKETGWFSGYQLGQGAGSADGKIFTSVNGTQRGCAKEYGTSPKFNFSLTPKGTIDVIYEGDGNSQNLQPYITVYRWVRTA